MWKEIRNVFKWYYSFSQVGAISQAIDEGNKKLFRFVWFVTYAIGWGFTMYLVYNLAQGIHSDIISSSVPVH